MPVVSVESFDSLACKQLDRLEYVAPVIKKEPEEVNIVMKILN